MGQGEIPHDFEFDAKGDVVLSPERFSNDQEIIDTCQQMLIADHRRIPWRSSIDGLFNGNPTYQLSWLKAKGQAWRARVNYRGLEGLIQSRSSAFYDLVSEVDPCIEVSLDFGKGVETQDWANAISKNFHWMLMKLWRMGFNFHVPLAQLEMLKHGIGFHVWPGNKTNWIPRTPLTGMILFPDGASLNIDEDLDFFMLRDFVPGYQLYQHIKNPSAAMAMGWNPEAVWAALVQANKSQYRGAGGDRYTIEMAQREYKHGDIGTSNSRQSGVWLNHLFVKEIDSTNVSQYTVAEGVSAPLQYGARKGSKSDPWANCLFRKRHRFDDWPLVMTPYDIGSDGYIHSVRGLGARTKDFYELCNRIDNAIADQILVSMTMPMKQMGNVDPEKLRLMRLGVMSIIPRGLEPAIGLQIPPLQQGPLAFRQLLDSNLAKNNQSYLQGTPEPKDRETAKSFEMRNQNSGQVSKGVHALYASNYQRFLERIFRIASRPEAAVGSSMSANLAREFQQKCLRDGVPLEALAHVAEVNEVFATGAGSAAARIDAIMTIMKLIYPTTTEARKINIERDLVAAVTSGAKIDRYARSQEDNELPGSDASLAAQENNGLMQLGEAIVSGTQDHVLHLQIHLKQAETVAQAVMQGQFDPVQGLAIIKKFGEHCAEHLKLLQQNPMRAQEFDALHKEWLSLSLIADKLEQQVSQMQAAQQRAGNPQQKVSDQLQIGMAKVQAQERIGMAKVQSKGKIDLAKISMDARLKAISSITQGEKAA